MNKLLSTTPPRSLSTARQSTHNNMDGAHTTHSYRFKSSVAPPRPLGAEIRSHTGVGRGIAFAKYVGPKRAEQSSERTTRSYLLASTLKYTIDCRDEHKNRGYVYHFLYNNWEAWKHEGRELLSLFGAVVGGVRRTGKRRKRGTNVSQTIDSQRE